MKSNRVFFQFLVFTTVLTGLLAFVLVPAESKVQKHASIEGRYLGQWSSTPPNGKKYDKIPISAIIRSKTDSEYTGEFFFTKYFAPCCDGELHNGTLEIRVVGNKIISWIYNDLIPNCHGTFQGTGEVESNGNIRIDFEGSDCEGEHADAFLTLIPE